LDDLPVPLIGNSIKRISTLLLRVLTAVDLGMRAPIVNGFTNGI